MKKKLFYSIGKIKTSKKINCLTKNYFKFVFQNFWIYTPTCYYLIMFYLYKDLQSYLGLKCEKNFIVAIDKILFGEKIYDFMVLIQHPMLDLFSALCYLAHFCLPIIFSAYLIFYKRENNNFLKFFLSFGLVSFSGVIIQYLIPTPPPWMFNKSTSPEANFVRVDKLIDINLFKNLYSNSPLKCGACPSLHAAWPTVILFTRPWINVHFCCFHVASIAFAAIYSGHHYVIDVLFGFFLAWFFTKISNRIIERNFSDKNYIHTETV